MNIKQAPWLKVKAGVRVVCYGLWVVAVSQVWVPSVWAGKAAVTETDIRAALKGTQTFTAQQLADMDLNSDGAVDVADLVKLLKSQDPSRSVADFATSTTYVKEGGGAVSVAVSFSTAFKGDFRYTVEGTAVAGTDFNALSGLVSVNGTQATIPITILDNGLVQDVRTISLTIYFSASETLGYLPGGATVHTIYITDNDEVWRGLLQLTGASLPFQMRIAKTGSGISGTLVTDGAGIIPLNGTSYDWPAQLAVTSSSFNATVGPMPLAADTTLAGVELDRKLVFSATAPAGTTIDTAETITGTVTEEIKAAAAPQFDRNVQGTFSLIRPIANVVPQRPELQPISAR